MTDGRAKTFCQTGNGAGAEGICCDCAKAIFKPTQRSAPVPATDFNRRKIVVFKYSEAYLWYARRRLCTPFAAILGRLLEMTPE